MDKLAATIIVLVTVVASCHCVTVANCNTNSADDIIKIINLDVHPTKIQVPGPVSISATINITKPINGNLVADVTIKRKIGFVVISLPCVKNVGSCTYKDVCGLLKDVTANGCPKILRDNKIPCSCPVASGVYSISGLSTDIADNLLGFKIPLLAGDYQINLRLTDSDSNEQIACFVTDVELVNPPSPNIFNSVGRFLTSLFEG